MPILHRTSNNGAVTVETVHRALVNGTGYVAGDKIIRVASLDAETMTERSVVYLHADTGATLATVPPTDIEAWDNSIIADIANIVTEQATQNTAISTNESAITAIQGIPAIQNFERSSTATAALAAAKTTMSTHTVTTTVPSLFISNYTMTGYGAIGWRGSAIDVSGATTIVSMYSSMHSTTSVNVWVTNSAGGSIILPAGTYNFAFVTQGSAVLNITGEDAAIYTGWYHTLAVIPV